MNLTPIINALRKRCPTFERRFAGAAEWAGLTIEHAPAMPAAYVVPLREDASENESQNGYYQAVTNTFGVIVLVSNAADVRGQGATATLESLKPELFRALLSWHQEPKDEYSEIVYEGGSLLYMDDARLAYQLEFSFETYLDLSDTYQQVELDGLPEFDGMYVDVDQIEPSATGRPDGRPEAHFKVEFK